jgi:bla regulator protein BlaR1
MAPLFEIGVTNAILATVLALVVWCVTRFVRQPALAHLLWVLVLVKLVTPAVVSIPWAIEHAKPIAAAPSLTTGVGTATNENASSATELAVRERDSLSGVELDAASVGSFAPKVDWIVVITSAWIAGSVVWLIITIVRLTRFHLALNQTCDCSYEVGQLANEVAEQLGVAGRFRIRMTDARLSPLVWPIGRPTILLSRPMVEQLSCEETKTLVAHELAHLRRKDHWIRWLEFAVTAIYWWHPVVWISRRMIRVEEEQACDAWVVSAFPEAAKGYASALFKVVQMVTNSRPIVPLVASGLGSGGNLKRRIEDIMNSQWSCRLSWQVQLCVLASALLILPISLRAVIAGETDEGKSTSAVRSSNKDQDTAHSEHQDRYTAPAKAKPSNKQEASAPSDEVAALREHVQFLEEQFKKQDALYQTGSRGGSADRLALTAYELNAAKSELDIAEGQPDAALHHSEEAQKFADEALKAVSASYEVGRVSLDLLLQTSKKVSESKLRLARLRRGSAPAGPRPAERSAAMNELAQLASSSAPVRSIGMLQKLLTMKKEEYDRLAGLAENKVITASELSKAKADYEYSQEELRQAKHTLEYRKALVDLAKAEYQQAVEANKQAANAVSEFELRRLKIMVDLAEAKLKEVAE